MAGKLCATMSMYSAHVLVDRRVALRESLSPSCRLVLRSVIGISDPSVRPSIWPQVPELAKRYVSRGGSLVTTMYISGLTKGLARFV